MSFRAVTKCPRYLTITVCPGDGTACDSLPYGGTAVYSTSSYDHLYIMNLLQEEEEGLDHREASNIRDTSALPTPASSSHAAL